MSLQYLLINLISGYCNTVVKIMQTIQVYIICRQRLNNIRCRLLLIADTMNYVLGILEDESNSIMYHSLTLSF